MTEFQHDELNLLLIEDDDVDAKAIQRALKKANFTAPVHRALDGVEAFEILKGFNNKKALSRPYIILLDLNLPCMSGLEFLKILRDDARAKDSIVFILTTSNHDEDKIAAYQLNVSGYILKEKIGRDYMNLVALLQDYLCLVELP